MTAALLTKLIEAGTPLELVGEVAAALAQAEASARAQVDAANAPTKGALRTRRWRERHAPSQNVTCDAGDAQVTENVTAVAPSPPSPNPPQTPQEPLPPHPHPDSSDAHTRGLAAQVGLAVIVAGCRSARWRGMPPPAGVSDERWKGWLEHRRRHRKGGAFTAHAYKLLCEKLEALGADGWPPGEMIDRAIERGWVTVFPPDEKRNDRAGSHSPRSHRTGNGLLDAVLDAERRDRAGAGL